MEKCKPFTPNGTDTEAQVLSWQVGEIDFACKGHYCHFPCDLGANVCRLKQMLGLGGKKGRDC